MQTITDTTEKLLYSIDSIEKDVLEKSNELTELITDGITEIQQYSATSNSTDPKSNNSQAANVIIYIVNQAKTPPLLKNAESNTPRPHVPKSYKSAFFASPKALSKEDKDKVRQCNLLLKIATQLFLRQSPPAGYKEITYAFIKVIRLSKQSINIPKCEEIAAKANELYAHYLLQENKPENAKRYLNNIVKKYHLNDKLTDADISASVITPIKNTLDSIEKNLNQKKYRDVEHKFNTGFAQLKKIHHLKGISSIYSQYYALYGQYLIMTKNPNASDYLEISNTFAGFGKKEQEPSITNNPNSSQFFNTPTLPTKTPPIAFLDEEGQHFFDSPKKTMSTC